MPDIPLNLHLFNYLSDGVLIVGPTGHIRFANSATQNFLQRSLEQIVGTHWEFPLLSGHIDEITLPAPGGKLRFLEIQTNPIEWEEATAFLVSLRDITDRKQAEEDRHRHETERQYAQKLESLGVLAGGIAHDFNNLLMTIVARAGLAQRALPPESPAKEHLQFIERSGLRGGELANQMLTFAGQTHVDWKPIDLSLLIKDLKTFLHSTVSKRLSLAFDLAPNLPDIRGDRAQLRQMIMNITTNAAEAIGDREGQIILQTSLVDTDIQDFQAYYMMGDLPIGPLVAFHVSDTGVGMKTDIIPKIFDPFFTTKFPGRGLGLAASLGITKAHGAAIAIRSAEGKGTEFWVLFPSVSAPIFKSGSTIRMPPQAHSTFNPTHILVVDDETDVREVCSMILREMGWDPLVATNGETGLPIFLQHQPHIALVILDLAMPQMDGERFLHNIRRLDPHMPILISSGCLEEEAWDRFRDFEAVAFLQKPFQVEVLVQKIQALIGHTKSHSPINESVN